MLGEHQKPHVLRLPVFRRSGDQLHILGKTVKILLQRIGVQIAADLFQMLADKPEIEIFNFGGEVRPVVERNIGRNVVKLLQLLRRRNDGAARLSDIILLFGTFFRKRYRGLIRTRKTAGNPDNEDMLILIDKRLGNRLIKRLQIIADLAKFLFNIVDTVLRDPFYREYGRAVFLFDADDNIASARFFSAV